MNRDGRPATLESVYEFAGDSQADQYDGESSYVNGPVAMVYRPFHTTIESCNECQPHVSTSGTVITWDGRLDNRDELILELSRLLKEDHTDVAIVSAAFDYWGMNCFIRLLGDWSAVIYDKPTNTIVLARDFLGIRQLFYHITSRRLEWSSRLDLLALAHTPLTICDEWIAGYLAFHPDADITPYNEIKSVPPGKLVVLQHGRIKIETYWEFRSGHHTIYKHDAQYEEHYRHLFRQAVRRRLRSQSSILAHLSGGFDSSAIVCMADEIARESGVERPRVDTFSYFDTNEPEEDDLTYLAKVEARRGRRGLRIDLKGCGDSLTFAYDTFVPVPGFMQRAEISAGSSVLDLEERYRVVLSGTGGDEMNGQSLDPRIQMADMLCRFQFLRLFKNLTAWSLLIRKRPWIQLLFQTIVQLLPVSCRALLTQRGRVNPWISAQFARQQKISLRQLEALEMRGFPRPSARDAMQTLATLARRMTYVVPSKMEYRYPYLDRDLVEFLTSIPLDQLLRPGQRRSLMRRALAKILPEDLLARETKAFAIRCYTVSLAKHWDQVLDVVNPSIGSKLGYLDQDGFRDALGAVRTGQAPLYLVRLLKALSLELWLRDVDTRKIAFRREAGDQFDLVQQFKGIC